MKKKKKDKASIKQRKKIRDDFYKNKINILRKSIQKYKNTQQVYHYIIFF